MDRKQFFKELGLKAIEALENTGFVSTLENITQKKERPPGAISEKQFLNTCTGCDACMIACPVNIIMVEDLETRLPVIYPEKDPCIHCDGYPCIQACPTGALMSLEASSKERREHPESTHCS